MRSSTSRTPEAVLRFTGCRTLCPSVLLIGGQLREAVHCRLLHTPFVLTIDRCVCRAQVTFLSSMQKESPTPPKLQMCSACKARQNRSLDCRAWSACRTSCFTRSSPLCRSWMLWAVCRECAGSSARRSPFPRLSGKGWTVRCLHTQQVGGMPRMFARHICVYLAAGLAH